MQQYAQGDIYVYMGMGAVHMMCMYDGLCSPTAHLPAALPPNYTANLSVLCSAISSLSADQTQIHTS